jgi:Integrase zinc binding domain/Integrase core domain
MSKCIDDKDYIIKCNNVIVGDDSILTNAISDDASECIKQLAPAQKSDETLEKIVSDSYKPNSQYFLRNDILNRRATINDLLIEQLIVPVDKRMQVIEKAHDPLLAGHYAARKILQKISQIFWWPNMKRQIQAYVNSCIECQRRRRITCNDRVPIAAIVRPGTAFETIHIDVIEKIEPPSTKNEHWILCVIDVYSRLAECFPLKTLTAKETCDKLIEMFMKYGIPISVVSDNATNMVSGLTKELYKRLGVELRLTIQKVMVTQPSKR